jgi:hypothetical protein
MGTPACLAGGGGATVSPSSTATSGSEEGQTGNLVLNFGGINLGNQDIPITQAQSQTQCKPATVGNTPTSLSSLTGISSVSSYTPYLLIGALAIILYLVVKK